MLVRQDFIISEHPYSLIDRGYERRMAEREMRRYLAEMIRDNVPVKETKGIDPSEVKLRRAFHFYTEDQFDDIMQLLTKWSNKLPPEFVCHLRSVLLDPGVLKSS